MFDSYCYKLYFCTKHQFCAMTENSSLNITMPKTRQLLLDVARQLFAKMGVTNTTMNDIATASKKGRRTLYIYFKSKEDMYYAVVEQEMSKLVDALEVVTQENMAPQDKLVKYIYTHLDTIRDIVKSNGSLRADFFNDIKTVERVRRKVNVKELAMLKTIIQEGVSLGIFEVENIDFAAFILLSALNGLEVPYMKESVAIKMKERREFIVRFIFAGLSKQPI